MPTSVLRRWVKKKNMVAISDLERKATESKVVPKSDLEVKATESKVAPKLLNLQKGIIGLDVLNKELEVPRKAKASRAIFYGEVKRSA